MNIRKEMLSSAIRRFKTYKELGDKTFEQLADAEFHYQPNAVSGSIAIIIQHMHGNMMSRWTNFLTEDGEKEWRQRDEEFETHEFSREKLLGLWEAGWSCLLNTLGALKKRDLKKTVTIRGEKLSVIDAIHRQLAHYPYHVGQIVYIGKMIRIENWKNLSVPKGGSAAYNQAAGLKDPARKFS